MVWNYWVLAFIPVAWFLQNCIHEFSHLLVGWKLEGRKPLGFWPYPHRYKGRLYFARYELEEIPRIDLEVISLRYSAPFYAGLTWMAICLFASLLFPDNLKLFCAPFVLAGLVDALFFWWTYFWGSELSDGKLFKYAKRLQKKGGKND
jgi:hypothetical protein